MDNKNEIIYNDEIQHQTIKKYFHEETKEYRVLVSIGLNDFCPTEFIYENEEEFNEKVEAVKDKLIETVKNYNGSENDFVKLKGIVNWKYGNDLPNELEGFKLFINPQRSLEITNGSFVIINYVDFDIQSDLAIYYNVFSDNFGSEMRIDGKPNVTYDFDAESLEELEEKLKSRLKIILSSIRDAVSTEKI